MNGRRAASRLGRRVRTLVTVLMATGVLVPSIAFPQSRAGAPSSSHGDHEHAHGPHTPEPVLCPGCPASRESSGTSWQPDASDVHVREHALGAWWLRTHARAALVGTHERGPRGGRQVFSTNHVMATVRRPAGGGMLALQSMWSLEPAMGAAGYPLLLQTGETADGQTPLVDRQHPHDLPMEIAVTYARRFGDAQSWFVYLAPVGAPAFGPPPFMHRASAGDLPISPITHHWFDSTHITAGVVTAGFTPRHAARIEVSGFRGREVDERRWGVERPALDSFAMRLSVNPHHTLALQVSLAQITEPEPLHPGADVGRLSASMMYARRWRAAGVDATVAWARSRRATSLIPVTGGFLEFPGAVSGALLAEAAVRRAPGHSVVVRVERTRKDELFPLTDPRHGMLFPVSRSTLGYGFDIVHTPLATATVGGAVSWSRVSSDLREEYGGPPASFLAFLSIRTH